MVTFTNTDIAKKFIQLANGMEWKECKATARAWTGDQKNELMKASVVTLNYNEVGEENLLEDYGKSKEDLQAQSIIA